ncbi:MAG: hypothetical protein ACJ8CR_21420 [Roseiflexaceae bacterium]
MSVATQASLSKVLAFLDRLEEVKIPYTLAHVRETIMVKITVPGERWEVEFFEDGEVEVERFISTGVIEDEEALDRLFAEHSD